MYDLEKMIALRDPTNPDGRKTLQEIGDEFGISRERVRQLLPKSVNKKAVSARRAESKIRVQAKTKTLQEHRQQRVYKNTIHGTFNCYIGGCKCSECRRANNERNHGLREERYRRFAAGEVQIKNHNVSAYVNWGCRCTICTAENNRMCTEYNERRKLKKR